MFDAKSLFEMMVRGARSGSGSGARAEDSGLGDIGDLLRHLTQGQSAGGAGKAPTQPGAGDGGLGDILSNIFPGQAPSQQAAPPQGQGQSGSRNPQDILGDILGKIQQQGGGSGSLTDILGQVFGQATQGAREGAGKIGEQAGMRELVEKMSGGRSPEELMRQLQDFMNQNKLGTGAALGGLGALILGTQTGRSIAAGAAKIGALALIGGLAYKAYQNYTQGRPLVANPQSPEAAPAGTGFDEASVSNDAAIAYIRAMIAAAASDGRLDQNEQERILGSLSQQGLDAAAEEFLANELNNPATVDQLASAIRSKEEALQLYTAARVAIELDTSAEERFLAALASRLGIDDGLRAHIDAAARGAAA